MTHDKMHNDLFEALEGLEDEIIELLGDLRGKLIDWLAAAARGDLSLGELEALLLKANIVRQVDDGTDDQLGFLVHVDLHDQ